MLFIIEESRYISISALASAFNLNTDWVKLRLNKKRPLDRILGLSRGCTVYNSITDEITIKGRTYSSIDEACTRLCLIPETTRKRLYYGESIKTVFETDPSYIHPSRKAIPKGAVVVFGEKYTDLLEACKAHNVESAKVRGRLRVGYGLDEAFKSALLKHAGKKTIVEGQFFGSFVEACRHYNQLPATVFSRIKLGWDVDDAFTIKSDNAFKLADTEYPSVYAACVSLCMNSATVHARLKRGESYDDAFETYGKYYGPVTIAGREYPSLGNARLCYRIKASRLRNGISAGLDLETIFKTEYVNLKHIVVDGVLFRSVQDAARHFGIQAETARSRIASGCTKDVVFKSRHFGKSVTILGQEFPSVSAACEHFNVCSSTMYARLRRGWSIDKAFSDPVVKRNTAKPVTVEGDSFPSVYAAAKHYNIDVSTVSYRINKQGWDAENAIKTPVSPILREPEAHTADCG